jgi:hypothetical protein
MATRRGVNPSTSEMNYSPAELEFLKAIEEYKRRNRRLFPTWSEALEVLLSLGYRQVEKPVAIPTKNRSKKK